MREAVALVVVLLVETSDDVEVMDLVLLVTVAVVYVVVAVV